MIELSEVQRIGTIVKPHGVGGEMAVTVPASLDWTDDLDCLVCSMDGILVPFFLESIREKSNTTILVKFEGYDTVEATSPCMPLMTVHRISCSWFVTVSVRGSSRPMQSGLPRWTEKTGRCILNSLRGLLNCRI